jgi:5-methylcytosine-specific restriction endonuclease McrA
MDDYSTRTEKQKFYTSKEWRLLRQYFLALNPWCIKCKIEGYLVPAVICDHIQDIQDAPELRLEITNIQGLCIFHHNQKTMKKTMKMNNQANKNREKQKLEMKRIWKI